MTIAKITTRHDASTHGVPVVLAEDGALIPPGEACRQIRALLGWSARRMAEECGVSLRTVQGWEWGKTVPASALNVWASLIGTGY